ncbi:transmembrane protein 154 [Erinaceus europaeus]|uniref:Transmembrane protein 154 n=1 Tax=Erinaceus europaeus TaxID=9365 RepID=A0ABM3WEE8_ERIEU|nr:transmembrane protein 154 [Erinaceus europaeus]
MKQETGNVSGEAASRQHLRAEWGVDMKTQGSLAGALLLALLPGLHAQGLSEDTDQSGDDMQIVQVMAEETTIPSTLPTETVESFMTNTSVTHKDEDSDQLGLMMMVLIPLILLAVLFLVVVLFVTYQKKKRTKEEPSSQGSQSVLQSHELGSESLKVPIFEEDTPSVMEIEMEELDKWMNSMNRNADHECLPTVKEEKESNHNPSDNES